MSEVFLIPNIYSLLRSGPYPPYILKLFLRRVQKLTLNLQLTDVAIVKHKLLLPLGFYKISLIQTARLLKYLSTNYSVYITLEELIIN